MNEHPFQRKTAIVLGNEVAAPPPPPLRLLVRDSPPQGQGLLEKVKRVCDSFIYIPQVCLPAKPAPPARAQPSASYSVRARNGLSQRRHCCVHYHAALRCMVTLSAPCCVDSRPTTVCRAELPETRREGEKYVRDYDKRPFLADPKPKAHEPSDESSGDDGDGPVFEI